MRHIVYIVAACLAAVQAHAAAAPKGCFEKIWNKSELKKLPLQAVTAIRLESNLGPQPESKPHAYGILKARFRETGDAWLTAPFECSDTGAGFACAAYCDGNVFVISPGGRGLQLLPPQGVSLAGPECEGLVTTLKMNADQVPFTLARRGGKNCPNR